MSMQNNFEQGTFALWLLVNCNGKVAMQIALVDSCTRGKTFCQSCTLVPESFLICFTMYSCSKQNLLRIYCTGGESFSWARKNQFVEKTATTCLTSCPLRRGCCFFPLLARATGESQSPSYRSKDTKSCTGLRRSSSYGVPISHSVKEVQKLFIITG